MKVPHSLHQGLYVANALCAFLIVNLIVVALVQPFLVFNYYSIVYRYFCFCPSEETNLMAILASKKEFYARGFERERERERERNENIISRFFLLERPPRETRKSLDDEPARAEKHKERVKALFCCFRRVSSAAGGGGGVF